MYKADVHTVHKQIYDISMALKFHGRSNLENMSLKGSLGDGDEKKVEKHFRMNS